MNPTNQFHQQSLSVGLYSNVQTGLCQTWHDSRDCRALHFDVYLDDQSLHSRSQLYEKSKTSLCIFSEILQSMWMEFSMLPLLWFVEAHVELILLK